MDFKYNLQKFVDAANQSAITEKQYSEGYVFNFKSSGFDFDKEMLSVYKYSMARKRSSL